MKKLAAIIVLTICANITAGAQTFLDRLQKSTKNQGIVTVTQNADIDKLVNGNGSRSYTPPQSAQEDSKTSEQKGKSEEHHLEDVTFDSESSVADTRKKVMLNSYKTDGYRVQAYAGGNTRKDRQTAEKIGNDIKRNFPDQPIYVHFYSPRWICRVGNYKSYEEAHKMLQEIRKLGYNQASVVKGKITLQY